MAIDWGKAEESAGGNFKDYAENGVFKVKLEAVKVHEIPTGSVAQDFTFEETDDYKFPKVTHWLSFKNDNWRIWHNKCLMELLGATEAQAKSAIETCEGKGNKDAIVKAYQAMYDRLATKHPEVEIEVWKDTGDKYSSADFTSRKVRMSNKDDQPLKGAEEINLDKDDLNIEDIPF